MLLTNAIQRRLIATLAAGLAIFAGGCATAIPHDVTVFHEWPAQLAQRSFALAPRAESQSLEARTYANIVREQLLAAGFVESASPALEVDYTYKVNRREVRYTEPGPVFTPYFALSHRHSWGGVTIGGPIWWGWPYYDRVQIANVHAHELKLTIDDVRGSSPKRIFEGTAARNASEPAAVQALPLLMQAVLADFPGTSGVARRVSLEPMPDSAPIGTSTPASASSVPAAGVVEDKPPTNPTN